MTTETPAPADPIATALQGILGQLSTITGQLGEERAARLAAETQQQQLASRLASLEATIAGSRPNQIVDPLAALSLGPSESNRTQSVDPSLLFSTEPHHHHVASNANVNPHVVPNTNVGNHQAGLMSGSMLI